MRYDRKVDAAYIELAKGKYSKTRKVSDVVLVDEDKMEKYWELKSWMQPKIFQLLTLKNPIFQFNKI